MKSNRAIYAFLIFSFAFFANQIFAQSGRIQPTPAPTPDEPIRVVTEEVKLNVIAFDEEGIFFSNVTERDLVITENDILHQPTSVRRIPANVLVVMDTGGELRSAKSIDQTRKTAMALVDALRPEDSVALLQYANDAEVIRDWTADRTLLATGIAALKFGRRSNFLKALKLASNYLTDSDVDNKHLVLITDGTDSNASSAAKLREMKNLLAFDFSVHVLSYTQLEAMAIEPRTKLLSNSPPPKAIPDEVAAQIPGGKGGTRVGPTINLDRKLIKTLKARQADLESSEEMLRDLAENTNGEIFVPYSLDEMLQQSAKAARLIDSSYVVTYLPKIGFDEDNRERNISVSSKRPGLYVDARRKLIGPRQTNRPAEK